MSAITCALLYNKSALKQAQFDKCFACESPVSAVAHGDVEHFRPKGGFQQKASDPVTKPGYYWLAYRWENLFFSCQICNQTHKKNLFPLRKAADRCLDHTGDLSKEAPLFLDPARDDPRKHIEFVDDVPRGRKNSKRGNATIDGLGLLRDQLQEARRKTFVMAQLLADLAIDESVPAEQRNRVNTRLQEMRLATQPYSAMIDDMLRAKGL